MICMEALMTQDLRVKKTQAAIHHAFWKLLATRPLPKISVADLIAEAQIGKATFYHHYVDKFDLARQLCQQTQAPLIQECAKRIASHQLHRLFLPLPDAILQDASHIRLLDTIQTPEFNGQTHLIEALTTSFQRSLLARDPTFSQPQAVSLELATLYQHVVIIDLLSAPMTQMLALQQAIPVLFAKP
ncbi:TetR family transcriptional regulator [Lacticaseibacillus manihotivorans]|nr:TetR family transcriptional regulator [Lacticaseibacillus manihotivorans]